MTDQALAGSCSKLEHVYNALQTPNKLHWAHDITSSEFYQLYLKERDLKTDSADCTVRET